MRFGFVYLFVQRRLETGVSTSTVRCLPVNENNTGGGGGSIDSLFVGFPADVLGFLFSACVQHKMFVAAS